MMSIGSAAYAGAPRPDSSAQPSSWHARGDTKARPSSWAAPQSPPGVWNASLAVKEAGNGGDVHGGSRANEVRRTCLALCAAPVRDGFVRFGGMFCSCRPTRHALQAGDEEWQAMFKTLAAAKDTAQAPRVADTDQAHAGAGDENEPPLTRKSLQDAIDEATKRRLDEMGESGRRLQSAVGQQGQLVNTGRLDGNAGLAFTPREQPTVLTQVLSTATPTWAKQLFTEPGVQRCDAEGCMASQSDGACRGRVRARA